MLGLDHWDESSLLLFLQDSQRRPGCFGQLPGGVAEDAGLTLHTWIHVKDSTWDQQAPMSRKEVNEATTEMYLHLLNHSSDQEDHVGHRPLPPCSPPQMGTNGTEEDGP